jgi:hypothetical protein
MRVKPGELTADRETMTFELSTPVKIAALVGLMLVLLAGAGAAYTMALQKHQQAVTVVPSTPTGTKPGHHPAIVKFAAKTPKPAPVVIDRNLPAPLRGALRYSKVVVAVVWSPGVAGDADVVQAARLGAATAGTGFVALNVAQEPVAAALAAWAPQAADPAVLVVKRPGTLVVELDGWADQNMVAQAALDAR